MAELKPAVRPIRPDQVVANRSVLIPSAVIESFNTLISEAFDGEEATVQQERVLKAICADMGISRDEVFEKHYLDVEPLYEREGWKVSYRKPAYNEDFAAYFVFQRVTK